MVWIALQLNLLASYRLAKLCKIWAFRGTERARGVGLPRREMMKTPHEIDASPWHLHIR